MKIAKLYLYREISLILACSLLLLVVSCGGDQHLYDRPGFDPGTYPAAQNPNITKMPPNYYPAQQPYAAPPSQPPYQYQQQPYQAPPQQYQQPPASYGQQPGSRFYSNPYAIPPAGNYYNPYYDADQYYVPTPRYNNIEPSQNDRLNSGRTY